MSAKPVNLKHPAVMAVVVVAIGGVVFLNMSTFGSSRKPGGRSRGARVQAHVPVPLDVKRAIHIEPALEATGMGARQVTDLASLGRDPFFPTQQQPQATVPTARARKSSQGKSAPKVAPLVCSATMPGGRNPLAVINGQSCYLGDVVRSLTVQDIDADGVLLVGAKGKEMRLVVGQKMDESSSFSVVTRTRVSGDEGRTRMSVRREERNP